MKKYVLKYRVSETAQAKVDALFEALKAAEGEDIELVEVSTLMSDQTVPWDLDPALDHLRDKETGDWSEESSLRIFAGSNACGAYVRVIGKAVRYLDIRPINQDGSFFWLWDHDQSGEDQSVFYGNPACGSWAEWHADWKNRH
jgi:hypothetical protein